MKEPVGFRLLKILYINLLQEWHQTCIKPTMFKSYLHVAWRNLQKNKVYSVVNIAGLAVGLAVFWLLTLYIADELSYDRASVNANRIYRVTHSGTTSGGGFKLANTPPFFGPALEKDYPEIEAAARIDNEGNGSLVYGE